MTPAVESPSWRAMSSFVRPRVSDCSISSWRGDSSGMVASSLSACSISGDMTHVPAATSHGQLRNPSMLSGVTDSQIASGYAFRNVIGSFALPFFPCHLNSKAFSPLADSSTRSTSCCCAVRQKNSRVSGSCTRRHFALSANRKFSHRCPVSSSPRYSRGRQSPIT